MSSILRVRTNVHSYILSIIVCPFPFPFPPSLLSSPFLLSPPSPPCFLCACRLSDTTTRRLRQKIMLIPMASFA